MLIWKQQAQLREVDPSEPSSPLKSAVPGYPGGPMEMLGTLPIDASIKGKGGQVPEDR